jgi:phosphotransferase family enzyme
MTLRRVAGCRFDSGLDSTAVSDAAAREQLRRDLGRHAATDPPRGLGCKPSGRQIRDPSRGTARRRVIDRPEFASLVDFVGRLDDVSFWEQYVHTILRRHGLSDSSDEPAAGYNPTWPTFVCGDVVVKLFGYHATWRRTFDAERNALSLVSAEPSILAPGLLGEGALFDSEDAWAYLLISRLPGTGSWPDEPSADQWPSIARELGEQVKRIHSLHPSGIVTDADWPDINLEGAAARSSLPPHLVAQVGELRGPSRSVRQGVRPRGPGRATRLRP